MASDKKTYIKDSYIKLMKDMRESYKVRKEFLSSYKLKRDPDDEESDAEVSEDTGNSVLAPGGIGNFTGSGELVCPAENKAYRYTSGYGTRWGTMHWGIDLAPKTKGATDCKILAAGDGVVLQAGPASGFGQWIVIKHKDDLYTIYGHMPASTITVKAGDEVEKGQHIAYMGQEGESTGVHLHLEITRDFNNRKGNGKDGKPNTIDPETVIDVRTGMTSMEFEKDAPAAQTFQVARARASDDVPQEIEIAFEAPMHSHYSTDSQKLDEEAKRLDRIYRQSYTYRSVRMSGKKILTPSVTRESFLYDRVGWGRTTNYEGYVQLDNKQFIHQIYYDGYEGNLYSPDAKSVFESLLLKTKKPYLEVISGFRYSNSGLLSPHEAGCAMDIRVQDVDDAREIADCAWQIGIRSIAIGGNPNGKTGFIHLDIAPKGKDFAYNEIPIYGGPGKWVTR